MQRPTRFRVSVGGLLRTGRSGAARARWRTMTHSVALFAAACSALHAPAVHPQRWLLSYDGTYLRSVADQDFYVRAFAGAQGNNCSRALFDGVIFLGVQSATEGKWFAAWANKSSPVNDASVEDWFAYVDTLAAPAGPLVRLDRATSTVPGRITDVVIMVPALMRDPDGAVRLGSVRVDLEQEAGRSLYSAYLDTLLAKFERRGVGHLRLRGVYWLRESAWGPEATLARQVAEIVHSRNLQFFWIPYFGAGGVPEWRTLGFDAAWLQPNYFLRSELSRARLDSAVAISKSLGMGLEIEMDGRIFTSAESRRRLSEYLGRAAANPDLPITVYDGGGTLVRLFRDTTAALAPLRSAVSASLCR